MAGSGRAWRCERARFHGMIFATARPYACIERMGLESSFRSTDSDSTTPRNFSNCTDPVGGIVSSIRGGARLPHPRAPTESDRLLIFFGRCREALRGSLVQRKYVSLAMSLSCWSRISRSVEDSMIRFADPYGAFDFSESPGTRRATGAV